MVVDDAGHHHAACQVDDLGRGRTELFDLGCCARGNDAVAANSQRFYPALLRISGIDVAVQQERVR